MINNIKLTGAECIRFLSGTTENDQLPGSFRHYNMAFNEVCYSEDRRLWFIIAENHCFVVVPSGEDMNNAASSFKALLIDGQTGEVQRCFNEMKLSDLDADEILINILYLRVNYKDALSVTGKGKIIRRFPCIGGIDLAGAVVSSEDPRLAAGDKVVATSFDIGVAHHGGYAQCARIPGERVVAFPAGMSLFDSRLEQPGLRRL